MFWSRLIRGAFARLLDGFALAYHLPLSSEAGRSELRGKTKNKKKGRRAPKHQSIFASVISMFYVLKEKKVLKKEARRQAGRILFWAL